MDDDARIRPGPEPGEPGRSDGESRGRRLGRRLAWGGALALAVPALIAISVPVVATGQDVPDPAPTAAPTTAAVETADASGVDPADEAPDGQVPGGEAPVGETPADAAAAEPAPPEPAPVTGTGRDPLTPDEAVYAQALAAAAAIDGAEGVDGAPGVEPLSVEFASADPDVDPLDAPRLAEVYGYDYATDELVKQVVDLSAGAVVRTASAPGMQPPPSEAEIAAAFDLFLADVASEGFRAQYRLATGSALTEPEQVTVTGASFVAPDGAPTAAECGTHRCLNLFAQIPDGPHVDLSAIVIDLSDQTVTRL